MLALALAYAIALFALALRDMLSGNNMNALVYLRPELLILVGARRIDGHTALRLVGAGWDHLRQDVQNCEPRGARRYDLRVVGLIVNFASVRSRPLTKQRLHIAPTWYFWFEKLYHFWYKMCAQI